MKLYTCTKCGKKKQKHEFYKGKGGKPRPTCKTCFNADCNSRYASNPEPVKAARSRAYHGNIEVEREKLRKYYSQNKSAFNAYSADKRARKLLASPPWLTPQDKADIKSVYKSCRNITKKTGVQHHVDHIIPLQGKTVCGLHVPHNLRVLPAEENLRKSNSFDEDMI